MRGPGDKPFSGQAPLGEGEPRMSFAQEAKIVRQDMMRRVQKACGVGPGAYPAEGRLPFADPSLSLSELDAHANGFPSMGGVEMGSFYRQLAGQAPAQGAIVEVGVWLGASLGQLAYGIAERRARGDAAPRLFGYDLWVARRADVKKAAPFGEQFTLGQDMMPRTLELLRPFGADVTLRRGEIRRARWSDGPIGVYIDDASKSADMFRAALLSFGPAWTPGVTIVALMDFYYYRETGQQTHRCQRAFMAAFDTHFEEIEVAAQDAMFTAAFLYKKPLDFREAAEILRW